MDDSDLRGLDFAAAKEQVLAYAIDVKRFDRDIATAEEELKLWRSRQSLAQGKGMAELAQAAGAKVEAASARLEALRSERDELKAKVERMRRQLPSIRAAERSVDPDRLLAELQLMTGELLGEAPPETVASAPAGGRDAPPDVIDAGLDGPAVRAAKEAVGAAATAAAGAAAAATKAAPAGTAAGAAGAAQRTAAGAAAPQAGVDREFSRLEAETAAEAALAELKRKMAQGGADKEGNDR